MKCPRGLKIFAIYTNMLEYNGNDTMMLLKIKVKQHFKKLEEFL